MLSLNQLKLLRALSTRKHRQKYHKFIAEGEKIVNEALLECPELIEMIVQCKGPSKLDRTKIPENIPVYMSSEEEMKKISLLQTPPGILCVLKMPDWSVESTLDAPWLVYLEGIRDPGNLGTIIRSADWFGLHSILLSPDSVEWSNPKVVQAAMGSIFRTRCLYGTLDEFAVHKPNAQLFAADLEGKDIHSMHLPSEGILVLGNESHGLSKEIRNKAIKLTINRHPNSRAESLNVATAAGILFSKLNGTHLQ